MRPDAHKLFNINSLCGTADNEEQRVGQRNQTIALSIFEIDFVNAAKGECTRRIKINGQSYGLTPFRANSFHPNSSFLFIRFQLFFRLC